MKRCQHISSTRTLHFKTNFKLWSFFRRGGRVLQSHSTSLRRFGRKVSFTKLWNIQRREATIVLVLYLIRVSQLIYFFLFFRCCKWGSRTGVNRSVVECYSTPGTPRFRYRYNIEPICILDMCGIAYHLDIVNYHICHI